MSLLPAVTIQSPEDLFSLVAYEIDWNGTPPVSFGEGFDLHFKISGKGWTGQIDYRVGQFVFELQRDIMKIYSELTGERLSFRNKYREELENILVTVETSEGSLDIRAKLHKAFSTLVKNMTGKEKIALAMGICLLLGGGYYLVKREERMQKLDELTSQMKIEEGRQQIVNNALEIAAKNNTALTNIIAKTTKDDQISVHIGGQTRVMSAEDVKQNLPEKMELDTADIPNVRSKQVWGDFTVTSVDNRTYTFNLSAEGVPPIRAVPSFPNNAEQDKFFQQYNQYSSRLEIPRLKLLLSVVLDNETNEIEGARIHKLLLSEASDADSIQDAISETTPVVDK